MNTKPLTHKGLGELDSLQLRENRQNDYKINASEQKDLNIKDKERPLGRLMKPSNTFTEVTLLIITL